MTNFGNAKIIAMTETIFALNRTDLYFLITSLATIFSPARITQLTTEVISRAL